VANCINYARYGATGATLVGQIFDEVTPASHDIVLSAHMQNSLAVDALELYGHVCCLDSGRVESNVMTVIGVLSCVRCRPRRRAVRAGENKWNGKVRQ
jgi:hypothetical protein